MNRTWPQLVDARQLLCRVVAFVSCEPISRIEPVKLDHHPITRDLRQHTGRGNGITSAIALYQGRVRDAQRPHWPAIYQDVLRGRTELIEGELHGPMGGLQN